MWRRPLPVLLAALCSAATAHGQQYDLRTFSLEQGLPSASVNAICEDADGFLWVATDNGLARGQGSRFEAFDRLPNAPGTQATALLATTDSQGGIRLWSGYRNGALGCWSAGTFIPWATSTPLPTHPVRTLLPGPENTLWLASRGGGIWRVDTMARTATAMHQGLPSLRINALAAMPRQALVACTDSGLFHWKQDRWHPAPANAELRGRRALSVWVDSLGVLVGTNEGYLELDHDLAPLPLAQRFAGYQPLVLPHPVVLAALRSSAGDLWLGTPGGLVHLDRRGGVPHLTTMTEANGLGHDLVRCLHQDRSGGTWAGTGYGGISKFTSDAFLYVTERDGLGSRIVSGIHRCGDGLLWFGTQGGGVARFDGGRMQRFGREQGLPSLFVTCLGEDVEGYLLAGTAMHGLHRLVDERFVHVQLPGLAEQTRIHAIHRADDGQLHIATGQGLYIASNGRYTAVGPVRRSVHEVVTTADSMWLATDSGLYVGVRGTGGPITRVKAVPTTAINDLVRDPFGSIWMGTADRGLLRLQGGRLESYGREAGMQSLSVEQVMLDAYANLWLGTRQGIHQVELDALQEQVLGIRSYGPEDGFIGLESLRGAGLLDTDSSLWFGTVRGAIRYDPQQVVEDPREPLVHLMDMQLFYERPDWSPWCHGMARNGLPTQLELPHDKNHLTFVFTGISLAYPEKVRFRWILEGYDPDWSPITATQRVTYSNIPPGDYTFKVMARNASGIWNEQPVAYTFSIAPPFWRTNTFRFGGGATLLLGFFGLVRLRERNLRRDRQRLEATVAKRTAELEREKDRSDALLRNILPASTAEELKRKGSADARRYEHCTVLFSDFKGFTTFSSRMDSDTLVAELDHYFRLFDTLCGTHGLEKIKTIGDAYMCAAGIPEPSPTHALDGVLMALGMLDAVERSNDDRRAKGLQEWPVRIGLHSGPVVAGVVGEKKFAYDIWGDTVNLASRMESNGEAGQVNISGPVYAQVMDLVVVRPRGPIKVKGKGEVQMYFVERLRPEWSGNATGTLPNAALLALRAARMNG
ncbi:MAG: hypothetical protein IPN62_16205 [Flavobacteriales bacterium]|nr:hypothetical protein [Flavobacteriales bacterium]